MKEKRFFEEVGTLISLPDDPLPLTTHYRIKETAQGVLLENQVKAGKLVFSNQTILSKTGHQLVSYQAKWGGGKFWRATQVRVQKGQIAVQNRLNNEIWKTNHVHSSAADMIPFTPYGYAEIVWMLKHLIWKNKFEQAFPMLHLSGSDFGFQGFMYQFQVLDASFPIAKARCFNLFDGILGLQMEPYDLTFNRKDETLLALDALLRPVHLRFSKSNGQVKKIFKGWPRIAKKSLKTEKEKEIARTPSGLSIYGLGLQYKSIFWIFDLFRFQHQVQGSEAVRQSLSQFLNKNEVGTITFNSLAAFSDVGPTKMAQQPSAVSLDSFKKDIKTLWKNIENKDKVFILALEENAYLAPLIFENEKTVPTLILANVAWGKVDHMYKRITRMGKMAEPDQKIAKLLSEKPLQEFIQTYPGKVYSMGSIPPPQKFKSKVEHIQTSSEKHFGFPLNKEGLAQLLTKIF